MQELANSTSTAVDTGHIMNQSTQIMSFVIFAQVMKVIKLLQTIFSTLGIFTNIANILVFWRMGFTAVSNISLFSLSIVDLICVLFINSFTIFSSYFYSFILIMPGIDYVILANPLYRCFPSISSWITAVISTERCCCILLPLKVKLIFTRKNVVCVLLGRLVYQTCAVIPHYLTMRLIPVSAPQFNRTILVFDLFTYNKRMGIISLLFSVTIPTFICFILVLVGTIFLVIKLQQSAEFRRSMTEKQPEKISTREKTVARSVVGICVIYISCMTPDVAFYLVCQVFPQFHALEPVYGNIAMVATNVATLGQSVSASVNIFVYIKMMSQYRDTFNKLFGIQRKKNLIL